jgi:hypothetical protein
MNLGFRSSVYLSFFILFISPLSSLYGTKNDEDPNPTCKKLIKKEKRGRSNSKVQNIKGSNQEKISLRPRSKSCPNFLGKFSRSESDQGFFIVEKFNPELGIFEVKTDGNSKK